MRWDYSATPTPIVAYRPALGLTAVALVRDANLQSISIMVVAKGQVRNAAHAGDWD